MGARSALVSAGHPQVVMPAVWGIIVSLTVRHVRAYQLNSDIRLLA